MGDDESEEPRFRVIAGGGGGDDEEQQEGEDELARDVREARRALAAALLRLAERISDDAADNALALIDEAVAHDPMSADAHYARSQNIEREPEDALSDLTRALELAPTNARYYSSRASLYCELAHLDELDDPTAEPRGPEELEHLRRAVADLNRAIHLRDDVETAHFRRARAHDALGHFDEAYADYTRALGSERFRGRALRGRLALVVRTRDRDAARAEIALAVAIDPEHPALLFQRAILSMQDGELAAALADATQLIERDRARGYEPSSYDFFLRAGIHLRRDAPEEAAADLDAALGEEPTSEWFLSRRGQAFLRAGDLARAIADFEAAAASRSADAERHIWLARALALRSERDDLRRATAHVRRAIALEPVIGSHHGDLARIDALAGRPRDRRRHAARGVALVNKHPSAQGHVTRHHLLAQLERYGLELGHPERISPDELAEMGR